MALSEEIVKRIQLLEQKYTAMGQDLVSYLDGLLYADFITYWDYIHLDTLLSLQHPKTSFPDESVFIMYHQITELFFKLSLHELKQITDQDPVDATFMAQRIQRVNRYFSVLTTSFDIMVDGMEPKQFQQFRMSLLPASGFQSAQYRTIEIFATDFINLVAKDHREKFITKPEAAIEEMFQHIYWNAGATELATGKKTLTLKQFEEKYSKELIALAEGKQKNNLFALYKNLSKEEQNNSILKTAFKQLDINVNINWPLMHYKSAVRYLHKNPEDIAATGGTNWQKYLPPRFQKRVFYPELWSVSELEDWGKSWVEDLFASK